MSQKRRFGPGNAMPEPMPIDLFRQLLRYDRDTGDLFWLTTRGCNARRISPGDKAGTLKANGYVVVRIDHTAWLAHRLAWFLETGIWPAPDMEIDHINGIKGDNRWSNMRLASRSENQRNHSRRNATGYRGVFRTPTGGFVAKIKVGACRLHFPRRDTAAEAFADYCSAALEYHGAFARLS